MKVSALPRRKLNQYDPLPSAPERKSNLSYINNMKADEVLMADQWRGRRCFIVGGGESLLGFDYRRLDGELSIGINRAYEKYDFTIAYFMDTRYYDWIKQRVMDDYSKNGVLRRWNNFPGHKIFLCPLSKRQFDGGVRVIRRLRQKTISRDIKAGICGGKCSGFGAIMLAMCLGANPIYLLGYDMRCQNRTHWHSGYPKQTIGKMNAKLESFRKEIGEFAPQMHQFGYDIVNLSPCSALECFKFGDVDGILPKTKEVVH